jgi:membrane-anchored protein YejM (alkaline phosphatase superfamily)
MLRSIALVMLLAGSMGSLYFMFHVSRNNHSVILHILFTGWVASPYICLAIAYARCTRWPVTSCRFLYFIIILLASLSLVVYSAMLLQLGPKPAGMFLTVPLASWIVIGIAALVSRKMFRPVNTA